MGKVKSITYTCQFCGRKWQAETKTPGADTGWIGFLVSAVRTHTEGCRKRTPEERYRLNKKDEQRRKKRPPQHTTVTVDWDHPGMKSAA